MYEDCLNILLVLGCVDFGYSHCKQLCREVGPYHPSPLLSLVKLQEILLLHIDCCRENLTWKFVSEAIN